MSDEWQPIETLPKNEWVLGLRPEGEGYAPAFVGKSYDIRPGALLNGWSGKWAMCIAWRPLNLPSGHIAGD